MEIDFSNHRVARRISSPCPIALKELIYLIERPVYDTPFGFLITLTESVTIHSPRIITTIHKVTKLSKEDSNYWVIVPAAGIGSRMANSLPKQYLPLLGKNILQQTLEKLNLPQIAGIVVCIAPDDPYWEQLNLPMSVIVANGGAERCHSVLNGLEVLRQQKLAQPHDWVLVHDAARPCVRREDIEKLMNQLAYHPVGGLLASPVRDTMKRVSAKKHQPNHIEVIETVNRVGLWHALTPQMFRLQLLWEALQQVVKSGELVTDDAQAIERLGYQPVLVEGHADNIKITHPQDLSLAKLYLEHQEIGC